MKMISRGYAGDRENQPHQHVVPPASKFRLGLSRRRGAKRKWHRRRRRWRGGSWPGKRTVHKSLVSDEEAKERSATLTQYLCLSIGLNWDELDESSPCMPPTYLI